MDNIAYQIELEYLDFTKKTGCTYDKNKLFIILTEEQHIRLQEGFMHYYPSNDFNPRKPNKYHGMKILITYDIDLKTPRIVRRMK